MSTTARTGNYMNWVNVVITPQSGTTAISLTEVTKVNPGLKQQLKPFYGDNRRFAKMLRAVEYQRSLDITTGDAATANTIPLDQPCTITATLCDAKNGTGSGALNYTFKNAVMGENSVEAANNEYGMVTLHFECYGDDSAGVDGDPFSYTVVP